MVPFESLGTVSYLYPIVNMALTCIVSEIKRDIGQKSRFFIPPAFNAPVRRVPVGILSYRLVRKKYDVATRWRKKSDYTFSRLDTIPACDGQTDRQLDTHLAAA